LAFKVHDSNIQIGIRNVVKRIINKEIPSIAKITVLLAKLSQENSWTNWNCIEIGSKKKNRRIEHKKTREVQKSENFRTAESLTRSIKSNKTAPIAGSEIKADNI
jgi:hypothetical protein